MVVPFIYMVKTEAKQIGNVGKERYLVTVSHAELAGLGLK